MSIAGVSQGVNFDVDLVDVPDLAVLLGGESTNTKEEAVSADRRGEGGGSSQCNENVLHDDDDRRVYMRRRYVLYADRQRV